MYPPVPVMCVQPVNAFLLLNVHMVLLRKINAVNAEQLRKALVPILVATGKLIVVNAEQP